MFDGMRAVTLIHILDFRGWGWYLSPENLQGSRTTWFEESHDLFPCRLMNRWIHGLVLLILTLSLVSCNQPFDPHGPFENLPVVFCILDGSQDVQFLRLYTTFPESRETNVEYPITGANVEVTTPAGVMMFRDTTLPRVDTSVFKSPLQMYASPFQPLSGQSYALRILSPLGEAASEITLPANANLTIQGSFFLQNPHQSPEDSKVFVLTTLSEGAKGYVIRLFVHFDIISGGSRVSHSTEVPILIKNKDFSTAVFPTLRRKTVANGFEVYPVEFYALTLSEIQKRHPTGQIVFRKAALITLQAEENLYNYFSIVNAFNDRYSIRVDEPEFTNIIGGRGLFGGFSIDSLIVDLPPNFPYNRP